MLMVVIFKKPCSDVGHVGFINMKADKVNL